MKRINMDTVKRIVLELSLKPFGRGDGRTYEECARHVIVSWRPLLEAAEEVSFMLWVADGSEILEWSGNLEQPLEWARYVGFCNNRYAVYDLRHHAPSRNAKLYTEHPQEMRYIDLHAIVNALRNVGEDLLCKDITIGATFDPGPEFAESAFKYEKHPEIIVPKRLSGRPTFPMVDAAAQLHADAYPYAAYPQGIPEGEPFALFLGRQINSYCRELDFDYIWLSNGFGFSAVAWDYLGPAFDGGHFYPVERAVRLGRFKQAWEDLYRGNPDFPMEIRGSNFAAGMDIAKDGVDFAWLYEQGYVRLPPPNSPWGALNFDFGLEIAGFLSRAVKSPKGEYLFRYYPNDPWFWQNPWTDIFYGQAYDIYIPLATSVIDQAGEIITPSVINILTGDTEFGETDPLTGVQVAAHIRTALNDRPDDVGLITWVYPFEEYHDLACAGANGQAEVFYGDWFVRSLINNGLPIATIGTPEAFDALLKQRESSPHTVALLPTAAVSSERNAQRLFSWLEKSVPAILYGPAASLHSSILHALDLALTAPLHGELALKSADGKFAGMIFHDPMGSGGGIAARQLENSMRKSVSSANYLVSSGEEERAYCVFTDVKGTKLIWLRGTNNFETRPDLDHLALKPKLHSPHYFDTGMLGARILKNIGYSIDVKIASSRGNEGSKKASAQREDALMLFSRHDNAWFLSGYAATPVGEIALQFPDGAPIFIATYTRIIDGASHYPLARVMHHECRVFVRQKSGVVGCDPRARDEHHQELTLKVTGLTNATVTFYPPTDSTVTLKKGDQKANFDQGESRIVVTNVSGELNICW